MFVQKQEVISRKMEAAKQAAWGEAGLIIDDLQAALADVKQQLCNERAAHDQLEEDMKQSFMRSVCAINLEVSHCTPCVQFACVSSSCAASRWLAQRQEAGFTIRCFAGYEALSYKLTCSQPIA